MKKTLLMWNVILYAITYSVSLLYVGFKYGEWYPYITGLEYFLFPIVYLILLIIGHYLMKNHRDNSVRSYCVMAIVTLTFISLLWGVWLIAYFQGRMPSATFMDIVLFPAVLFFFSVMISIFYFICAAQTRKHIQEVKMQRKRLGKDKWHN